MSTTTFEVAAGSSNVLSVPREARDYINERAESRSFNLDSFSIDRSFEPHEVIIRLGVAPQGCRTARTFYSECFAWRASGPTQLTEALTAALDLSPAT